jgi:hypothetical protein
MVSFPWRSRSSPHPKRVRMLRIFQSIRRSHRLSDVLRQEHAPWMQRTVLGLSEVLIEEMVHCVLRPRPLPTCDDHRRAIVFKPHNLPFRKGHDAEGLQVEPRINGNHHGELRQVRALCGCCSASYERLAANWQINTGTTLHGMSYAPRNPTSHSTSSPMPAAMPRCRLPAPGQAVGLVRPLEERVHTDNMDPWQIQEAMRAGRQLRTFLHRHFLPFSQSYNNFLLRTLSKSHFTWLRR